MALVNQTQIRPISKGRSELSRAIDQLVWVVRHIFLFEIDLQQKCMIFGSPNILFLDCVPLMLRKSCNSLAELCPNKNESVLDVIAFFVEGRGTEIVG